MTVRYLGRAEVAEVIGVAPGTLGRYNLPEPDAIVGTFRGWLPATIDTWQANRPGPGNWGRRDYSDASVAALSELQRKADGGK